MVITPVRVRFRVDETSPTLEGVPTPDELVVATKEDYDEKEGAYAFHFEIQTHDRGDENGARFSGFYQIAFRIDDPSPYKLEELELHLDDTVFDDKLHHTAYDLFHYHTDDDDLWYQESRYQYNDSKGRYEVIKDDPNIPVVDSVTASGIFRVVARKKDGQPAKASGNPSPWIYVLPGTVSITEYKRMLSDLISLHEELIVNHNSSVGVGSTDVDYRDIKDIIPCLKRIIRLPAEQLDKKYIKTEASRISYFDQRVIQDYIRTGGAGKVTSIGFIENNNTYENKIIKLLIDRLVSRYPESRREENKTFDVIAAVKDDMRLLGMQFVDENNRTVNRDYGIQEPKIITLFDCGSQPWNSQRSKKIVVKYQDNHCVISTNESNSHNFIKERGKEEDYYNLQLRTRDFREALFLLSKLCEFYRGQDVEGNNVTELRLICDETNPEKLFDYKKENCAVYIYDISGVREINNQQVNESEPCETLKDYFRAVESLCQQYTFIQFQDSRYEALRTQESLIAKKRQENKLEIENAELLESVDALRELLKHKWFKSISAERLSLKTIRKTPKFIQDRNYAKAYKILAGLLKRHPMLSAEFNISAFGVKKTEQVYEYWVFYKILNSLINLGFRIEVGFEDILLNFKRFIVSGNLRNREHADYKIVLVRDLAGEQQLRMELGFDCNFVRTGFRPKTPDFYMMIPNENGQNWFFMDAKYKPFTYENRNGYSLYQEIYNVSISKYIKDIESLLPGGNNKIKGSFVIASSISETDKELSRNNRLFGAKKSIADCGIRLKNNEVIVQGNGHQWISGVDNANGYPCHRYGAIEMAPGKDEELKALLLMMFEYLLPNGTDNHPYLQNCWSCSSTEIQIISSLTQGGFKKYYSTCKNPNCSMFRVQNHCRSSNCTKAIIKHPFYNFHVRQNMNAGYNRNRWAYICPACGGGLLEENAAVGFDEPPPMTDEELMTMMPPADEMDVINYPHYDNPDELPF